MNEAPTIVMQIDLLVVHQMTEALKNMRAKVIAHAVEFGVEPGPLTPELVGIPAAEIEAARANIESVRALVESAGAR